MRDPLYRESVKNFFEVELHFPSINTTFFHSISLQEALINSLVRIENTFYIVHHFNRILSNGHNQTACNQQPDVEKTSIFGMKD